MAQKTRGCGNGSFAGVALIVGLSRMGNTTGTEAEETEDENKGENRGQ